MGQYPKRFNLPTKPKLTLKKVNRKINKLANQIEVKEFYKTIVETALDGNKGIVLNGMVKGDDNGQRQGNKITMIKIASILRLKLIDNEWDGDDTSIPWVLEAQNASIVRVILLVNKQNNEDAVFDLTEILRDGTTSVKAQTSMYNIDFVQNSKMKNKYRILYDKAFHLTPNQVGADRIIKINKSLRMNTLFNDLNLGTGGDIINHKVELLILPHKTGTMNYAYNSVLSYTDS